MFKLANRVISRNIEAFSLVEMLMALLVASLLMAALAPVMTKKINEHITVSGTGGAIIPKVYCGYVNDGNELLQKLTEKDGCVVPENSYNAGVIIASGGGGGGGAADMVSSSSLKNLVTATGGTGSNGSENYNIQSKAFDKSTKNILIKISGAGAGGGGGNYVASGVAAPKSQADCEPFGVYVSAAQNGGKAVCVSKYNPGENRNGSPDIPSSVKLYPMDSTESTSDTACITDSNCCWYGNNNSNYQTSTTDAGTEKLNGPYDARYRTVCQWNAANAICQNWQIYGRLPHLSEFEAWAPYINNSPYVLNNDSTGLQLCQAGSSAYNFSRCDNLYKTACHGTRDYPTTTTDSARCSPYHIWSDTIRDAEPFKTLYYINGSSGGFKLASKYGPGLAATVRCVLEETQSFTPYLGGGGSSGSYVELNVPSSVISEAVKNDEARIVTYAGFGGRGGNKENASSYGAKGNSSKVEIYDGTTLLWSLTVPGGNPGLGASKSSGGTNGKAVTENCIYFDKTSENYNISGGVSLECNLLPVEAVTSVAGKAGNSGNSTLESAGYGGASAWATSSGSATYGKGGNGSTCEQGTSATDAVCADGNSGEGGRVEAWHSPTYPGVGGGGGAAGTVLHIKNIQVRPKDLIKVQVGHGGAGGSINAKGVDGGSSFVEITRGDIKVAKYEVLGGGGGTAGIPGNPDTGKLPEIGKAGVASKLATGTKTDGGDVFPKNSNETVGTDAIKSTDEETSIGGNGGINPKTSPLATNDAGLNAIPCGGLNTGSIVVNKETTWQCTNAESNVPFTLSRVLSDKAFNSSIIQNLAAGSTGGGGGAWKYSLTPRAQGGAKGMGGYVFIYFGDWGDGE